MKKPHFASRFHKILEKAEQINDKERTRRFYPIIQSKNGSYVVIGLYDSKKGKKKLAIAETRSWELDRELDYMEKMVSQ